MTDFTDQERAILEARAARLARANADQAPVELRDVVVIRAGRDLYAIDARRVRAVGAVARLTPIPQAPEHVAGFASFRGEIVVVFHLHGVLGLPTTLSEHGTMVAFDEGVAIAVDAVEGFRSIDPSKLRPPPEGLSALLAPLVEAIDPDGVAFLRFDALLASERMFVDVGRASVAT